MSFREKLIRLPVQPEATWAFSLFNPFSPTSFHVYAVPIFTVVFISVNPSFSCLKISSAFSSERVLILPLSPLGKHEKIVKCSSWLISTLHDAKQHCGGTQWEWGFFLTFITFQNGDFFYIQKWNSPINYYKYSLNFTCVYNIQKTLQMQFIF